MIYSGTLNERLHFYHVVEEQTEYGEKTQTEVLRCSCRAYRLKNKENYGVDAENLYHSNELRFNIRYRKEIEETDTVVYNNDRYRITSLSPYIAENQITLIIAKIND